MRLQPLLGTVCAFLFFIVSSGMHAEKSNFLINTVDDMNFDSVGAFGCELANTTSNIDQLTRQGLRFMRESNDHALEAFEHRDDPSVANAYFERKQAEADARK
jgi:hypothetical protein